MTVLVLFDGVGGVGVWLDVGSVVGGNANG